MAQKTNDKFWIDESGSQIPFNRITSAEKLKEKYADQLVKKAKLTNSTLAELKNLANKATSEIADALSKENKIKIDGKGNFTWYNFDKSIKIETNINELIKFDEALIEAAKEVLMAIIEHNLSGDDFVKGLVADAFKNSKGSLDTKRILGLKKHTSRIKSDAIKAQWTKAMELIDNSITRPESKKYTRVYVKDTEGSYCNIELNFSSIK